MLYKFFVVVVIAVGQVLLSMRLWQEELTQAFQVYPGSCCKAGGCVSCSESITSTHRTVQEGWTQQVSFLLTKSEAEPQSGLTC